jgi:FkbM family methyltransferase
MNRFLVNVIACFIPKKKDRHNFREKWKKKKDVFRYRYLKYSDAFVYYGQCLEGYCVSFDKFIYQRYFEDKIIENGICIECGANDGVSGSNCKFFEETLKWTCYNLEPEPELFKKCCLKRPNSKNFQIGLGSKREQIDFVANHNGLNGALEFAEKNIRGREGLENAKFEVIKVPVIPYTDFIEQNKIKHVNFFSLDVERYEVNVLKGMKNCNVMPDIFMLEGQKEEYEDILKEYGYVFDIQNAFNCVFIKREKAELYGFKVI